VTLFVDTSVWFAAAYANDRGNARAKALLGAGEPLVTTDHVVVETWLLLRGRFHREAAERFWEGIREGVATVEMITAADFEAAWSIACRFPDQDFSITDRTSFALMERLGITRAASFDSDFVIYRYGRNRDRAFEILG